MQVAAALHPIPLSKHSKTTSHRLSAALELTSDLLPQLSRYEVLREAKLQARARCEQSEVGAGCAGFGLTREVLGWVGLGWMVLDWLGLVWNGLFHRGIGLCAWYCIVLCYVMVYVLHPVGYMRDMSQHDVLCLVLYRAVLCHVALCGVWLQLQCSFPCETCSSGI